MKILVATKQTQGQRPGDFMWLDEGEIVALVVQCNNFNDSCGCERTFGGTVSHRTTTTAMVVEHDLDENEYRDLLAQAYRALGWTVDEIGEYRLVDKLIDIAERFPVGTVVERLGQHLQPRSEHLDDDA